MSAFWDAWRKEIIRGATLFGAVLVLFFLVRYAVVRVRQRVAEQWPVALRDLGDLRELKKLSELKHVRGIDIDSDRDPRAGPRDTAADQWHYRGRLGPRQWVWIGNTNGSVTVEPAKGPWLEVTAVKTYHRSDPARVRIETDSSPEGIAICALWEGGGGQCAAGDFKPSALRRNDVAVDFRVRLPAGARLDAMTVSGAVSVAHASAPLVAATVNGAIDAETSAGPVRAMSVNGSVRARMSAFGDTGEVSLLTVNGAATAELPRRLDADVEATTMNGSIETDYPLEVTGKIGKHLRGTVGAGGRKVHITTVNGAISLKKAT